MTSHVEVSRYRFTIGRLMVSIGICAVVLAIAADIAKAGWFGLTILSLLSTVGLAYLVLFAVPRVLLRIILWLMPCFRAEDEDPL